MAKLYFRHGTVNSAKTLNLLAVAHNYRQQNKRVLLLKPRIDTRTGKAIQSRAGLREEADVLLDRSPDWIDVLPEPIWHYNCVLVDEAQFVCAGIIDQLRDVTRDPGIPVICYGLRTDFRANLFEGSRRLLEIADSIEEIKTTCAFCDRKALFNLRLIDGKPTLSGESVALGFDNYQPTCWRCYRERTIDLKDRK